MSYSIDVNILLYASDESSPRYAAASEFIRSRAEDPDLLCLAWPTLMGYLRIATHPRIFAHPLSAADALTNVAALVGLPHARTIAEEDGFLDVFREVTSQDAVRGNRVPDAHLAALLRQHGVSILYTTDNDFHKFRFLDVRNPLG